MSSKEHQVKVNLEPTHLFRYPAEWDPRQEGKTKGGYLNGIIELPKNIKRPYKLTLMTLVDEDDKNDSEEFAESDLGEAHPTMLHLVCKNENNRRVSEDECVPNAQHWCQKFLILGDQLIVINRRSGEDRDRAIYSKETDKMFRLSEDRKLNLGKDVGMIHLVVMLPKQESRARGSSTTVKKLL